MPRAKVVFLYLLCCVLWGSTWLVIKLGLAYLPPLLFAGLRMLLAAVLLLPFALRAGLLRRPELRTIALLGLLQIGAPYALLFAAQQWTPSGLAAVLFATFPAWIGLIAHALLPDQRLTRARAASALLGLAGIAVLQGPALLGATLDRKAALGGVLIVLAAILIALANVLVRKQLVEVPPVVLTAGQTAAGAALLLLLTALFEHGQPAAFTRPALLALAYLAVFGTALTYGALFWLLPRIPMAALGAIPLLDTLVALLLGTIVLAEPVTPTLASGGALILAGVALGAFRPGTDR